jgi:hypothetical protein
LLQIFPPHALAAAGTPHHLGATPFVYDAGSIGKLLLSPTCTFIGWQIIDSLLLFFFRSSTVARWSCYNARKKVCTYMIVQAYPIIL